MAKVTVNVEHTDNISVIIATGKDAIWCEFGAGVYHNDSVGNSPNPYGNHLGFKIGGFGENGKRKTWGFYENGELKITRGTPASMPMYNAVQAVSQEVLNIVQEVFQ